MFNSIYSQIGAIAMIAILAFALWKGREPERAFAGIYFVAWLATMLVQGQANPYGLPGAMLAIDSVVLIFLIVLSWKSASTWPAWACGFQLLTLVGIALPWIDIRPPAWSYITVVNLGSYGVLGSLAVGTFWAWQERRAAGLE